MLNLDCYVGALRPFTRPGFPLRLANRSIEEYFTYGSMDADGNPGISLNVDETSRLNTTILPQNRPTSTFYIQDALYRLTKNNPNNHNISRIGLLIGDRFQERKGILGIMFDQGFNPEGLEPVSEFYTSIPREGCAIFLDAIADIRPTKSEFETEVVFTAIHELGHVFNLWHINNPLNFMSISAMNSPYGTNAYGFRREQRDCLNHALQDPHIRPGGSNFQDHGAQGPATNNPFENQQNDKSELDLTISVEQDDLWYFEPLELDIILSLKANYTATRHVKDEIDPGYDSFTIYITKPDGTIFKYRPTKFFCSNPSQIEISKDNPFTRDISIFGQSGSYTFKAPGIYQVQCFFQLEDKVLISSNKIEVHIKTLLHTQKFINLKQLLSSKHAAQLLYYRGGYFSKNLINELESQSKKDKKQQLASNLSYAIVRYVTHLKQKPTKTSKSMIEKYLGFALESGKLSPNRVKNLVKLKEMMKM